MGVDLQFHNRVAVLSINNPTVNALNLDTRVALIERITTLEKDADVIAIILMGSGRGFSGGADVGEFGTADAMAEPNLRTLVVRIESCSKPIIAAIHGMALGGGSEIALACHYRVGTRGAQIGLPEVTLGMLPGAGGTQRMPRAIGVPAAIQMIVYGITLAAGDVVLTGYFDRIFQTNLLQSSLQFANEIGVPALRPPKIRDRAINTSDLTPSVDEYFSKLHMKVSKTYPNQPAPLHCLAAVEGAVRHSFAKGLIIEKILFEELLETPHTGALIHSFFSAKAAMRSPTTPINLLPDHELRRAVIIGTEKAGWRTGDKLAGAGILVTTAERSDLEGAPAFKAGFHLPEGEQEGCPQPAAVQAALRKSTNEFLVHADLVLYADLQETLPLVELLEIAKQLKPTAIIATDIPLRSAYRLALARELPNHVVPWRTYFKDSQLALIEVTTDHSISTLAAARLYELFREVGLNFVFTRARGEFVGDRLLRTYFQEVQNLIRDGYPITLIDDALHRWGAQVTASQLLDTYSQLLGEDASQRDAYGIESLLETRSSSTNLSKPSVNTGRGAINVVDRIVLPLINEACHIIEERQVHRPGDIDFMAATIIGVPAYRGGLLYYAEKIIGLSKVCSSLEQCFGSRDLPCATRRIASLLQRLGSAGQLASLFAE